MSEKQQLQKIIDEELICPVYQPIVSLHDGSVYGYEALSRITLRNCSFNVEEMFSLADREKCLFRLEALCRKKSMAGAEYHPAGTKLFINVTPDVIKDPQFHSGMTLQALGKYGLCASDIIFEITEKKAIRNEEAFFKIIRHYTEQNFQIAIDDFGDGFAGLNRIVVLAPHFLKLDIAMVRNIDSDGLKRSLVKGIVDFCRKYSIRVIAEGIETRSELKTLIGLGVEFWQGYYLKRPNPVMSDIPEDVRQLIIKYYNEFNQPDQRMYLWDQIGTIVHRERGYFVAKNRNGQVGNFKIASLSAAAVDIWPGLTDAAELIQKITGAKKQAKKIEGSSFVYWKSGDEEAVQVVPTVE
ncbi:MAG: EAL domain-containing protein [Eubacterium sp.]